MKEKKNISKKIYNHKTIEKIEKKIKKLGINNDLDSITFLNLRLITSVLVFFLVLLFSHFAYIIAPIVSVLYYFMFERLLLDSKIKRRKSLLENEAIYFFEVLTLSLETGRNLEEALRVSISSIDNDLSLEFANAIREVKFGKSLTESLVDMQNNIPSENINNIILSLTQADIFGNSIIDTLYTQIDYLREKQKLEIKAQISKVPIKISIISVIFFVPLILLIILSPVLLNYIN